MQPSTGFVSVAGFARGDAIPVQWYGGDGEEPPVMGAPPAMVYDGTLEKRGSVQFGGDLPSFDEWVAQFGGSLPPVDNGEGILFPQNDDVQKQYVAPKKMHVL